MLNEAALQAVLKPIDMQDVRLAVGEGPLTPTEILAGVNAELRRRASLIPIKVDGSRLDSAVRAYAERRGRPIWEDDYPPIRAAITAYLRVKRRRRAHEPR